MNASDLRRLYAYTDWANDRILAAIAVLSEEGQLVTMLRQVGATPPNAADHPVRSIVTSA